MKRSLISTVALLASCTTVPREDPKTTVPREDPKTTVPREDPKTKVSREDKLVILAPLSRF